VNLLIIFITDFTMNNLTVIILVSFSVINIIYMGSDLFTIGDEKVPKQQFGECKNQGPELQECQKVKNCNEVKNEKIVRKTKTSTKSKILGNGDLVEQTTVTEVIETIIHNPKDDIHNQVVCQEESSSHDATFPDTFNEEMKDIDAEKSENEDVWDTPVVAFGNKDSDCLFKLIPIEEEKIDEKKEKFEPPDNQENHFQQLIPNSTSAKEIEKQLKGDSKENKNYEDLPALHIQLSTGLHCCLSKLVTSAMRSWTFYLSGLIREVPLHCTDRCMYTRDNDSTSYCFTTNKQPSCTTNISSLMRLDHPNYRVELDDLKTEQEIQADERTAPVIKLNGGRRSESTTSCCPVKQVMGEGELAGLFVLRGKAPDRKSHCSDNCLYVKVGDVKKVKYCFGSGDFPTACHQKVPSISTLLHFNTTGREKPFRLEAEKVTSKLNIKPKDHERYPKNSEKKEHEAKNNMNRKEDKIDSEGNQQIKKDDISKDTKSTSRIKENKQEDQIKLKIKKNDTGKETTQNNKVKDVTPEVKDHFEPKKDNKEEEKEIGKDTKEMKQEIKSKGKNKKDTKTGETSQDEKEKNPNVTGNIVYKAEDEGKENWSDEMKEMQQRCISETNGKCVLVKISIQSNPRNMKDEKIKETQPHLDEKQKKQESKRPVRNKKSGQRDKTIEKVNVNKTQKDVTNSSELPVELKGKFTQLVEEDIPVAIVKNITINETDKANHESNVFVHNGIQIRKMPKKEIKYDSSDSEDPNNITMSFNQSKNDLNHSILSNENYENYQHDDLTSNTSKVDQEERTVFVVSDKCSAGYPMKIRKVYVKIEKNEEPISVDDENSTVLEKPLKIDQERKLPVEIRKSNENRNRSGVNSSSTSACSKQNDTIHIEEQSNASVNKSKSDIPNNNTETKIDKKNMCKNINNMDSGEGTRTLPYRITLTERPKLIHREKDEESIKAEIPIQISCGSGKPYKLRPVQKNDGEPVKLEVDFPAKGFIPVRVMPTDSTLNFIRTA